MVRTFVERGLGEVDAGVVAPASEDPQIGSVIATDTGRSMRAEPQRGSTVDQQTSGVRCTTGAIADAG